MRPLLVPLEALCVKPSCSDCEKCDLAVSNRGLLPSNADDVADAAQWWL